MKIKILSDLHTEFGNTHMIPDFLSGDYDILIIAGDLSSSTYIVDELTKIDNYTNKPVLFVPGNHEYYHSQKSYIDKELIKLSKILKNVHILNNDVFIQDDIVFIGSTGWWDNGVTYNHVRNMSDFSLIFDIIPNDKGMAWGRESRKFFEVMLEKYKDKRIVCISHNMPSEECISSEFRGSSINECFANKWDDIIEEYTPELWICGHTHDSFDMYIYNTRVVCNPYGYYKRQVNKQFNKQFNININDKV